MTHLLVPEQSATSTSWEVHDERQITNYFSCNTDLIMLGLIHTHPNMTSFLSSVDLHGLWDYARDNPSLVSIVLAPERRTAPAFCLTERGLADIGKCTGAMTGSTTRRLLMLEMIRLVRQLWWTLEFQDKPDYSFIL